MSFVGGPFEHDIFVTYSHGEFDESDDSPLKQWTKGFVSQLERELKLLLGRNGGIKIYLDQKRRPGEGADPMEPLTRQLKEDIKGSAVLSILMSPYYLDSKWCTDERDWWLGAQKDTGVAADGRIAISRIWYFKGDWPQELKDSQGNPYPGFCFYDKTQANEYFPQPYEWPTPSNDSRNPFRQELIRMVGLLYRKLLEVKSQVEEINIMEDDEERLRAEKGQIFYLYGRSEHSELWENIKGIVENEDFEIRPSQPERVATTSPSILKNQDIRVKALSECDALLLVGTDDEDALLYDLPVVGSQDRNEAKARSGKLLPCAVLDTHGFKSDSLPYQLARHHNVKWIQAIKNDWATQLRSWLNEEAN